MKPAFEMSDIFNDDDSMDLSYGHDQLSEPYIKYHAITSYNGNRTEELNKITELAQTAVLQINTYICRQPTELVERAFYRNQSQDLCDWLDWNKDNQQFDVVVDFSEYWTTSPVAKPSEQLKALQKKLNELIDLNIQKNISNSEKKKEDEKKAESLESQGIYRIIPEIDKISKELSENGDHPSCYQERPLGQYRYKGRNKRPEIILFVKNIYDYYHSKRNGYYNGTLPTLDELVRWTYIHELMHAIMHSETYYANIEEPLAEMGMLCFIHDALDDQKLEEKALHWVEQKQYSGPTCHYGYGAYLYKSLYNAEVGWGVGNLMQQYIEMNQKLSEKKAAIDEYNEYFLGGYPWGDLQMSALKKLFAILGIKRIKNVCHEIKDETLFEWERVQQIEEEQQQQIEEKQQQQIEEEQQSEEKSQYCYCNFWDDEYMESDIEIANRERLEAAFQKNIRDSIKNYQKKVNLGLSVNDRSDCTISSNNDCTFSRKSSRYCQDIYIDKLLKILKDENSRKELTETRFLEDSIGSIVLSRTTQDDYCLYKLKIRYYY